MDLKTFPEFRYFHLYRNVPEDILECFNDFKQHYPYQTYRINDGDWQVIDTQIGDEVVLIPASGTGVAEVAWETIEHLAEKFRVVSFDYPIVSSLSDLYQGVFQLFDQLNIGRVCALGGSGGTLFMQPLLALYPERISKLALVTPILLNPIGAKRMQNYVRWMKWMPTGFIRKMLLKSFEGLSRDEEGSSEMALVMALTNEIVRYRAKRENFISMYTLFGEMMDSQPISLEKFAQWDGQIQLIFGVKDPSTPEDVREKVLALYPQARMKVFEDGGHDIAVSHKSEYLAVLDEFFSGVISESE